MDHQTLNDVGLPTLPCACPSCSHPSSTAVRRSVKRRLCEEETGAAPSASSFGADGGSARVEIEDEMAVLREAMAKQQETIQELCAELDAERNAAASAASETMSMIIRLQCEKSETQMEARQFKRFAEEKMEHDQREMLILEDLLSKRDELINSMTLLIQTYRKHLSSLGIDVDAIDADASFIHPGGSLEATQFDSLPTIDYPSLKCSIPSDMAGKEGYLDETTDHQRYEFVETPNAKEDLENLHQRICELEALPGASSLMDKDVIKESPRQSINFRQSSADSHTSASMGSGKNSQEIMNGEEFPSLIDMHSDDGGNFDNLSDRVYTIDAVHGVPKVGVTGDCVNVPNEEEKRPEVNGVVVGSLDIEKLHTRLQALEADRESMRQTIVSMRTEKAQLRLLREIAQQLSKDAAPQRSMVEKKPSTANSSILSFLKLIGTFVLWKKKASRIRHTFGTSSNSAGLMLILDKTPGISNRKCIAGTQM
ncbi:myosin-binding protein 7-like isoform X1 [Curcuma longa]|uniref:myosin-binding protein 7-like isoform X1 n=1 Tax=Curcuma longa TaxID=136217 RepID=UPI003D9E50A2